MFKFASGLNHFFGVIMYKHTHTHTSTHACTHARTHTHTEYDGGVSLNQAPAPWVTARGGEGSKLWFSLNINYLADTMS